MELIVIGVLALLALYLGLVCRSNLKRINQLERDMTYLMAGKAVVKIEKGIATTNPPESNEQPEQLRTTADTAHMLRQAGVQEPKAYRAADIALRHGWQLLDIQENIKMVRYMRAQNGDVQKVNIYHGGKGGKRDLFTVASAINHPTKGKTQLFRKYITQQELEAVMKNPRAHTEKGYYQNGGK